MKNTSRLLWLFSFVFLLCLSRPIHAQQLIDFHFGSVTQTGTAALGSTTDIWQSSTSAANATPLPLNDVTGEPTGVSLTWLTGTAGYPGSLADLQTNQYWSSYDAATAPLMESYLRSYEYTGNRGAITMTLSGLLPSAPYTLILYGAGMYTTPTAFQVTGTGTFTGTVTGASRHVSAGPGVAYIALNVVSSATGTLTVISTTPNSWVYFEGFQLQPQPQVVNFHWGSATQTGTAVLGSVVNGSADIWQSSTKLNNSTPLPLTTSTGAPSNASLTWIGGGGGYPGSLKDLITSGDPYDAATAGLMESYISTYQYNATNGQGTISCCLTNLVPNAPYTLVVYSAASGSGGTTFLATGTGTFTGSTTGTSRKISLGAGVAYTTLNVVSSNAGTLMLATDKVGYTNLNGFQLSGYFQNTSTPFVWGINGHPTESDYANWTAANITTQVNDLFRLGCTYYRCSFEYTGGSYPGLMDSIVPQSAKAGITVLPDLPISIVPETGSTNATDNYNANYTIGQNWANYAISKGYYLPYWELGNEIENWGLFHKASDGASPANWTEAKTGAFVATENALNGARDGIINAYASGRTAGTTTVTPQILFGALWRSWGLLTHLQTDYTALSQPVPWDIISWHWYSPAYGTFNGTISGGYSNGRTPADCLGDFKNKVTGAPMDIWITETGRAQNVTGGTEAGSCTSVTSPLTFDQNLQATTLQSDIADLIATPSVKGILVYELYDETSVYSGQSVGAQASEAYLGMRSGLSGTDKTAFGTFQSAITNYGF